MDPNLHADSTDKELPKVDDEASDDKEDEDIDADTLLDNNEDPLADKDEDPSADGDDYSPWLWHAGLGTEQLSHAFSLRIM